MRLYHFIIFMAISVNICDALHNVILLVQFKKCEKHQGGVLKTCNFTKSNTTPWVFFMFFKLYKWQQIAQHTYKLKGWVLRILRNSWKVQNWKKKMWRKITALRKFKRPVSIILWSFLNYRFNKINNLYKNNCLYWELTAMTLISKYSMSFCLISEMIHPR